MRFTKEVNFLKNILRRVLHFVEATVFGTVIREFFLVKILENYYLSQFRRRWRWASSVPHFTDHRFVVFMLLYSKKFPDALCLSRAFLSAEVIKSGDCVLDIGCGDGFFSSRFFSRRARHIDAIDIEKKAIRQARRIHSAKNIYYLCMNAVEENFPSNKYDVIVWDGALGHFSSEATAVMLNKIKSVLHSGGVFVGSESLGFLENDHLQQFATLEDLRPIFKPFFRHIKLRQLTYAIGLDGAVTRTEAYWRCSNELSRLAELDWI